MTKFQKCANFRLVISEICNFLQERVNCEPYLVETVFNREATVRGAAKLLSNSLQVLKIGKELENKINWKLLFLSVSKIISTLLFCTS